MSVETLGHRIGGRSFAGAGGRTGDITNPANGAVTSLRRDPSHRGVDLRFPQIT